MAGLYQSLINYSAVFIIIAVVYTIKLLESLLLKFLTACALLVFNGFLSGGFPTDGSANGSWFFFDKISFRSVGINRGGSGFLLLQHGQC
jgi:hypothetical protein